MMKFLQPTGKVAKFAKDVKARTTTSDNMCCDTIKHSYVPAPEP